MTFKNMKLNKKEFITIPNTLSHQQSLIFLSQAAAGAKKDEKDYSAYAMCPRIARKIFHHCFVYEYEDGKCKSENN